MKMQKEVDDNDDANAGVAGENKKVDFAKKFQIGTLRFQFQGRCAAASTFVFAKIAMVFNYARREKKAAQCRYLVQNHIFGVWYTQRN